MSDSTISKDAVVIERTFEAAVDLIWQMWTDPDHFKEWYGPQGFSVPVAEMELRVGGKRLICMASPDGSMKMWTTGEYVEIVPNERLVYTESPADENGNLVSPAAMGMPEGYPAMTEVTVTLEDLPDKIRQHRGDTVFIGGDDPTELVSLEEIEHRYIQHVLRAVHQNRTQAAKILPRINCPRVTGKDNKGSSEPRSRSPAVESIARFMPPVKSAKMKK